MVLSLKWLGRARRYLRTRQVEVPTSGLMAGLGKVASDGTAFGCAQRTRLDWTVLVCAQRAPFCTVPSYGRVARSFPLGKRKPGLGPAPPWATQPPLPWRLNGCRPLGGGRGAVKAPWSVAVPARRVLQSPWGGNLKNRLTGSVSPGVVSGPPRGFLLAGSTACRCRRG